MATNRPDGRPSADGSGETDLSSLSGSSTDSQGPDQTPSESHDGAPGPRADTSRSEANASEGDAGSSKPAESGADRGEIFDLLSNHRRRYAIHYCKRESRPVQLGELAEHVAAWEHEKSVSEVTSAERKRVYTALQQTHLPTLERAGMIDVSNHEIALTENATDLEIYLDVVPGDSIPWAMYYLGLSGLGVVVFALLWLDVIPTGTIPALGWATLVFSLFGVSAITHVVQTRGMRLGEMERPP